MKKMFLGDLFQIHCYKHDKEIYRSWDEAVLLDIKKDYLVFGNNKTTVTERQGPVWKTKEPAIMYFFKDKWYNIIAQMKKDGIYYYCNIATPYIIEENTIKYIDYDLDLRIFPNGSYKILDELEYEYHKKRMKYSDSLDKVIHAGLEELIKDYKSASIMFDSASNYKYLDNYYMLKEENKIGINQEN